MLRALVKTNPDQFAAWLNLGCAQIDVGSWKKAFRSFTRCLEALADVDPRELNFTGDVSGSGESVPSSFAAAVDLVLHSVHG